MLCDVCKDSLEGIWDPLRTKRLELRENISLFPDSTFPSLEESSISEAAKEIQRYVFGHHKTRDSFLRSTAAGCVQCNRFPLDEDTSELGYFSLFCLRFCDDNKILVDLRYGGHNTVHVMLPWAAHETTWGLMTQWFSTCTTSHEECNALGTNGSSKPRRLLKIDSTGGAFFFQLVDGIECAVESAYMTLSYCWGSQPASEAYRLLKTTEQGMRSKQSVTILPRTIRDALQITSYFRVKYLWVDRLCIFQDSAEDFQREASTMADVYKNSILTIAALGAEDAESGCFFERNPRYVVPTLLHMQHDIYGKPTAYLLEMDGEHGWQSTFEAQPLINRAWTVQERLLAQRVVYFGSKQIFWECKHAHWCETHLTERTRAGDVKGITAIDKERGRWDHVWEQILRQNHQPFPPEEPLPEEVRTSDSYEQLLHNWQGIVFWFNKCALSVPSDKLVALSGLANEMRRRLEELRPGTSHRYVAGLWEEELPRVLAWRTWGNTYRAASYCAPTWSWASINGSVIFPQEKSFFPRTVVSSIVAIAIKQPPGEAETGQVEDASITLLGPVLHATIDTDGIGLTPISTTLPVASLCGASYTGSQTYRGSEEKTPRQLGINNAYVQFDTIEDIRHNISQIIIQTDGSDVMGIAIVPEDLDMCTYKRVGYFQYEFGNWMTDLSDAPCREAQGFVKKLPRKSIVIV